MLFSTPSHYAAFSAFSTIFTISEYFRYLLVSSPSFLKVTVTDFSESLATMPSTSSLPNLKMTLSPAVSAALISLSSMSLVSESEAFASALLALRVSATSSLSARRSSIVMVLRSIMLTSLLEFQSRISGTSLYSFIIQEFFNLVKKNVSPRIINFSSPLNDTRTERCAVSTLPLLPLGNYRNGGKGYL